MEDWLIPALSALVGVLIGSAGSITVAIIQGRSTNRRERNRLAFEAGLAEFRTHVDHATGSDNSSAVQPLSSYVAYYHGFMELVDKGKLTAEKLRNLRQQTTEVEGVAREITESINPGRDLDAPSKSAGANLSR